VGSKIVGGAYIDTGGVHLVDNAGAACCDGSPPNRGAPLLPCRARQTLAASALAPRRPTLMFFEPISALYRRQFCENGIKAAAVTETSCFVLVGRLAQDSFGELTPPYYLARISLSRTSSSMRTSHHRFTPTHSARRSTQLVLAALAGGVRRYHPLVYGHIRIVVGSRDVIR